MNDNTKKLTNGMHRDRDRHPRASTSPYAPTLGDTGPRTGHTTGDTNVEFAHQMERSEVSRQLVGTTFEEDEVWATVVTRKDGLQTISYSPYIQS